MGFEIFCTAFAYWYQLLGVRHVLLLIVLVGYSYLGGFVFSNIEQPAFDYKRYLEYNESKAVYENRTLSRQVLTQRIRSILRESRDSEASSDQLMTEALVWYENELGIQAPLEPDWSVNKWDIWGGIFYAGTLYTTIGYGHLYPETTEGRIASMIYAAFGIPLVITILNDWGNILFYFMQNLWILLLSFYLKLTTCLRKPFQRKKTQMQNGILPTSIGLEVATASSFAELPLHIVLIIFISWICLCAGIFCLWEQEWSYFTSFYFFFISLTTIGLGDVVPHYPQYAVMNFFLIMIGLSVVSMCINVVQQQLNTLFSKLIKKIDEDYKTRLEAGGLPRLDMGTSSHGTLGMMQLWAQDGGLQQRLLFHLMGDHKKHLLQEHWEDRAKRRNRATQTGMQKTTCEMSVQVGARESSRTFTSDEDDSTAGGGSVGQRISGPFTVKKYIYNIGE